MTHFSNDCTVILPTYNEEANIGAMIETLKNLYPDVRILVMDDNSKDGTKDAVMRMSETYDGVRFITRAVDDKGLSASIFQGVMETETEFFVNMDSDFQHPPETVAEIYDRLKNGSDLCIGVRDDRTALSFGRWLSSWFAHGMAAFTLKFMGKQTSHDIMSGLFGGKTDLFKRIITDSEESFERVGFKALFDLMKYAPSDIIISEVPFAFSKRQGGESKISSKIIFSIMRQCGSIGRFISGIIEPIFRNG